MKLKIKQLKSMIFIVCALSTQLSADFLGAEAGYALWKPKLTGTIQIKSIDNIDFEKDLGYGDSATNSFFWVYIDHPLPLLPNFKIIKTNYTDNSENILKRHITLSNVNLQAMDNVKSSIKVDQIDFIPYWRILDNWVNLDLGLNIKKIDVNLKVDTLISNKHVDESFSAYLPLLYIKVRFDLPLTGLSIEADTSYISYKLNKISDMKAGLCYNPILGLNILAGIRSENITLDDIDDMDASITISGMYVGLAYHF